VINNYKFFKNVECEYFPCHSTKNKEDFNCLFCYCPLYKDDNCGGTFYYLDNGIKDCSLCLIPHNDYDYIVNKLKKENELNET